MLDRDRHPVSEEFLPLAAIDAVRHSFVLRQPGIDADGEREEVVRRLEPAHEKAAVELGFAPEEMVCGEQIHGDGIARVTAGRGIGDPMPGVDGLVTAVPGVLLGIYVADCCAVYIADRAGRAVGLVHSGKKGTELGIAPKAIAVLGELGAPAEDLIVQLSPCIRPPRYEIDFAAQIRADCAAAGVPEEQISDGGVCTGGNLDRYYSYRVEKGRTGRMLALLGIAG